MEYVYDLLQLEVVMFIIIVMGIVSIRIGIISQTGKKEMTNLLLYLIFPLYIIDCFVKNIGVKLGQEFIYITVLSIMLQILTIILSNTLYNRFPDSKKSILQYATIVSNSGFLGFPLVSSIFGTKGLMYASIFLIFQRINNFSVGLSFFAMNDGKKSLKKVLTHPCILSTFIGIAILIFKIQLPVCIQKVISSMGACSTPLSMFLIGCVLANASLEGIVSPTILFYTAIRLVIIPAIIFIPCFILKVDVIVTGVAVILAGMPAGTLTVIMGSKYNKDEVFASHCVIFTTILSIITTPVWCIIINCLL